MKSSAARIDRLSIISSPAGTMPAPIRSATARPALSIVEAGQQDLRHRRARQQPDGDLHHHAEQPFGAGEQRQQVEAGAVQGAGPQAQALAFQGHDVHLQQVVHGQAVLQAMHAAGVLRDIAADGAGDLRGRVRCVVQTMRGSGLGDRQVAHARLDPGETTQRIDLEDPPETRHHQQHAVLQRQRAAGQPVPAPRATTGTFSRWQRASRP